MQVILPEMMQLLISANARDMAELNKLLGRYSLILPVVLEQVLLQHRLKRCSANMNKH
jgi:hypothetical protein